MAAKAISTETHDNVLADWRTGLYSMAELAYRHKISKAKVGQICKGVEKDLRGIVDAGVSYMTGLASHDRRIVDAIEDAVDERTKHIHFFNSAAVQNVKEAMALQCETQQDHRFRAETISKGRETVLGKQSETSNTTVNVNNQSGSVSKIELVSL